MTAVLITLIQNAALLLAMMVVFDLATSWKPVQGQWGRQVTVGVILGGLCICLILASFKLETGIIFDTRSVLLSLSGLFLGPIPTVIAMVIATVYRISLGGTGIWTGVGVIMATGGIGILWRHYRQGRLGDISLRELYGLGVVVHLVMLTLMLTLPWEAAMRVLGTIGLPVLLVYPIATIALGWLLTARLKREYATNAMTKSEARYRSIFENSLIGIYLHDKEGRIIDVNNMACLQLNYTKEELLNLNVFDLHPNEEGTVNLPKDEILHQWNHWQLGQQLVFEGEHQCKGGKIIPVQILTGPVEYKQGTRILAMVQDITERKHAEEELQRFTKEVELQRTVLEKRMNQSVNAISRIGELSDPYTAGHQKRVAKLSCAIGKEMGLSDVRINNLSIGGLLHDIGKFFVPSDILNKPSKVSDLEYQLLQSHVEESYNVVKEIDFPEEIHNMIYQHHERLDGSGYPQGISGDEIILQSRILAVADVVEAMTSHRPYRAALCIDTALEEILLHRGTKYDAEVVDICVKLFKEDGYAF